MTVQKNRNSQTSGFMDLSYVTHDEFTQKSTMSVSCPGPVDSNLFCIPLMIFLDLVRWNGVPFNDERIFQCLPRVEWMTILMNSSV